MGRSTRLGLLAAVLFALLIPHAHGAGGQASPEEQRAERLIFKRINTYRVNHGLAPLVIHNVITKEARKHSNYMANQGALSHDGFGARMDRIADADPDVDPDKACENTASAQGYDLPGPVAKRVFKGWASTGTKRRCLLDLLGYNTHSGGVGVEHRGDTWYATFIAANDSSPGG